MPYDSTHNNRFDVFASAHFHPWLALTVWLLLSADCGTMHGTARTADST